MALLCLIVCLGFGCKDPNTGAVVAYAAQDQVYAEPIFQEFTRQTGIKVNAVYDSEAVKTVGLANRLLAEKSHPQCDVFWGNEELRTRQLQSQGVFETNGVATFGYRSRRMVVNTNLLPLAKAPASLLELTNALWRGKVALAYPLFGTTATHFLALRQAWGEPGWRAWCQALQDNKPFLVDGNSVVVQLVGRGNAVIGLTDFDDIASGQQAGLPVASMPINTETLLIPNTVGVTLGCPHAREARKLFDYLQSQEVLARLVKADALEGGSPKALPSLHADLPALVKDVEPCAAVLKGIFLR